MKIEITVPEIGESVTSGIIAVWLKEDGDAVTEGDELFELETDKATLAIPSTATGALARQAAEGAEVEVGQVVALIDTDAVVGGIDDDGEWFAGVGPYGTHGEAVGAEHHHQAEKTEPKQA